MANPEHLEILEQGVELWNRWRVNSYLIRPDLVEVQLSNIMLEARYPQNDPEYGIVYNFQGVNFSGTDLTNADLRGASLFGANLGEANLTGANFSGAILIQANLSRAMLDKTDFTDATMAAVSFDDTYLHLAKGLDTVRHTGPNSISIDTLFKSKGKIPRSFLEGSGVPEELIVYLSSILTARTPIQFYSCFISYSSKDQDFAKRLHADLQNKGVRSWFAPEDLKIGERFRVRIDESIRVYDKLLLVLSENSVNSSWVEKEVETAMERESEDEQHRTVLFPVRLDNAVMQIKTGWPADVRRTRHLGDFTNWKQPDSYQKAFDRLLRDLKAEEKKG